jgi:hypothetical protein
MEDLYADENLHKVLTTLWCKLHKAGVTLPTYDEVLAIMEQLSPKVDAESPAGIELTESISAEELCIVGRIDLALRSLALLYLTKERM